MDNNMKILIFCMGNFISSFILLCFTGLFGRQSIMQQNVKKEFHLQELLQIWEAFCPFSILYNTM